MNKENIITTEVDSREVSVDQFPTIEKDQYTYDGAVKIKWEFEAIQRNGYVEGIQCITKEISGFLYLYTPLEDGEEQEDELAFTITRDGTLKLTYTKNGSPFPLNKWARETGMKAGWEIEEELRENWSLGDTLAPTEVFINFADKKVEIVY